MVFVFVWIVLCFIVGSLGSNRQIGFGWAFFLSIFLSPLVGLIIVLCSDKTSNIEHQNNLISTQQITNNLLENKITNNTLEELTKLQLLKEKGVLNEDEFLTMKNDILQKKTSENVAEHSGFNKVNASLIKSMLTEQRKNELINLTKEEVEEALKTHYLDRLGRISDEDRYFINQLKKI